jgi:gamma-D-glutamyl-L-lysine dipeptidyl-peptidase
MRCGVDIAPVRAAPSAQCEQVTQALRGEPLCVKARRAGWARIVTAYGYEGWLSAEALENGHGYLPDPLGVAPLTVARSFLGAPYAWGGLASLGIDCSGLVHMAYRLTGRLVPRDAWQQEAAATAISETDMRPGDLVTYGAAARADHIAFWVRENTILHATARDDLGVVEEAEPEALRVNRRRIVRL